MKIKIENILDKFLEKLNLKRIDQKGKVIKFDSVSEDKTIDEKKARKGSLEEEIIKENKTISKRGVSILSSMVLLLILTISLGLNNKNIESIDTVSPKDISSVATSSSIDNDEQLITNEEKVLATKAIKKEEKLIFSVPINGQIQKMYSTDKVIYSKTLEQWKTHDGLDISADLGSDVYSIERGVVNDIYDDSFYGTTIEVEHISGYISKYSNLDDEVYVNIGESIIKGQKIGKVGNTSVGEFLDEPHLHFMLYLNGDSIDPTYIYN